MAGRSRKPVDGHVGRGDAAVEAPTSYFALSKSLAIVASCMLEVPS